MSGRTSKQRVAETRVPLPVDYENERRGRANLFLTGEAQAGHRHITVTQRRPAVDLAQEVRDLLERLEIHHTPKHDRGLNMAEIELSVLSRQCLDRRIPDLETLTREVAAWVQAHNANSRPVNWRFTPRRSPHAQAPLPVNSGRVKLTFHMGNHKKPHAKASLLS